MVSITPKITFSWAQFSQEKEIWDELSRNRSLHSAFIEEALRGKQQHEQDILEQLLEEAYQHKIPDLVETILFRSPLKPSLNLFTILYSHDTNDQLVAVWKHYTFDRLQDQLIDFLQMIPNFIDLQTIVDLMLQSGADIRKLVLNDYQYTLIFAAEYAVVAQYWLKFLSEEDKKAEPLKKFSLSWDFLNQL